MKRSLLLLFCLLPLVLAACGTNPGHENSGHEEDHSEHDNTENQESHGENHHSGHGDHNNDMIQEQDVEVVWTLASGQEPQVGEETLIQIEFYNNDGEQIKNFDISHEKKMHLIIVSKDLSYFEHIHPEYKEKGVFEITNIFPVGGEYKLIADFVPTGGSAMSKMEWVHIEGEPIAATPIEPETNLVKAVDGKLVTLTFDSLTANKEQMLTFTIQDEKSKEPVTDLQLYLGAVGHIVILSEDADQYLHVHPLDEKASGPEAKFMTEFPQSGIYKIWGQFKHENKVFTVPFIIEVPL